MTTTRPTLLRASTTSTLCLWINRGLESLWLLAAVLVPLAFLDRDFAVSEAVIAYVEVPKIALLRTLAALMAVLWMVEWGLRGRFRFGPLFGDPGFQLRPSTWMAELRGWLREQPSRWLFLAVSFFLGTTLLSTALSGSLDVSLWGEVPGQDGYPAYTVVTYVVLFGVVATHLKTKPQLWRLLGAIVGTGVLIGIYAILQHYGHDFFDLTETTGGGTRRVTSFMGNTIFAAAVMLMTIPISLVAGTLALREVSGTNPSPRKVKNWMLALSVAGLWGSVMMVQLLGITFTFSRGPWIAMIVALSVFLGLATIFVGWRLMVRAVLLLGLTSTFILAVLQGLGSISILGLGPWLSAFLALAGALWVAAVLAPWRITGRVALGLGLAATLVVAVSLGLVWFKGDSGAAVDAGSQPTQATVSTASEVAERFSSIRGQVLGGFIGGRASHWRVSWRLIRGHPWVGFDTLSLSWLRPLVGYGPELFRYTYLLESPPEDPNSLFPLEPDHAHNFFIHQTVEQGFLGLLSSLGIFAAVFIVGGYQLLRARQGYAEVHTLLLIGLLAIFAGRFLEMNVGVARVSDLTILWLLLAIFAALPVVMQDKSRPAGEAAPVSSPRSARRRIRPPRGSNRRVQGYDWGLFWRLAFVAWISGGIFVLTWVKSVNYVRAAVEVGEGLEQFKEGDFQSTLASLDRAIELAPDVSLYYNHRANVYLAFQINKNRPKELGCTSQSKLPYDVCLAARSFQSNLEGVGQRPFYYRSRLALANSTYSLPQLDRETVQFYRESLSLVPNSWPIRNVLADALLKAGQPEEAGKVLEESLAITGNTAHSVRALFLRGMAYEKLGDLEKSVASLERSLSLGLSGEPAKQASRIMVEYYTSTGQAGNYEPKNAYAYFSRGLAYSGLGQYERAIEDYDQAIARSEDYLYSGSSQFFEYFFNRGLAYFNLERYEGAITDMSSAISKFPHPDQAEAFIIRGISYGELGQAYLAIQDLAQNEAAIGDLNPGFRLNPQAAKVHYVRGLAYLYLGQYQLSITYFDEAIRLEPGNAEAYAKRGKAYGALGQQDRAIQDLNEARRLGCSC
jgi:tetratricopeptide (TPR) repeat protein